MPELPDVETFKRYVDSTALHHEIERANARDARITKGISLRALQRRLRNRSLEETQRHGKHLGIRLDSDDWLILHFGMTGEISYYKDGGEPEQTRLLLTFSNGYHLAYQNQRRLGQIRLVDGFEAFITGEGLGPDALEIDFSSFRDALSDRRGALKSALMSQNVLAGIGNVYADETLYQVGLHPQLAPSDLDNRQLRALHRKLLRVLKQSIERQADPERLPSSWLLPHRHGDGQCPKGHGDFNKIKVSGRTTWVCPKCQPGP